MSGPMYEAFMKAAGSDPDKIKEVQEAAAKNDQRVADEQRRAQEQESEEILARAFERQKKAEEAEKKRLERERTLMSTCRPYSYTYKPYGQWSHGVGIVLAHSQTHAEEQVIKMLEELQRQYEENGNPEDWWRDIKNFKMQVTQIDLSTGIYTLFTHCE